MGVTGLSVSLVPPIADPFLAREQVRRDMLNHVEQCRAARRVCMMNLHGVEGLGVSSLATQFHRDNQRLIDGPLIWLAGRTADGSPTPPAELLRQLLSRLGVPETDQGMAEADLAQASRRLLARHACLIVIDDLAAKPQVEHLLSLDAPRVVLVVTAPHVSRELKRDGFRAFTPEFLSEHDARNLFLAGLGGDDIAEPALTGLVEQCGGIPLLVKILAAQLDGRVDIADAILTELRDARLDLLALDDERRMSTFFEIAYTGLRDDHAAAFRGLSLLPGPSFGTDLAAAALGERASTVALTLSTLVDKNLLVLTDSGRYAFHPVVRGYARARAATDDEPTRTGVLRRGITWLLREAMARERSGRWWIDSVTALCDGWYPQGLPDVDDAATWFDAEAPNLVAAVPMAAKHGLPELVVPLCVVLWKYLHGNKLHDAWIDTHRVGLEIAEERGDRPGVMQLSSQQGAAYLDLGETDTARQFFAESLDAAREVGHSLGEQSAHEWLGKVAAAAGDHGKAIRCYQSSWEFTEQAGDIDAAERERVFALLRLQIARSALAMRDWQRAVEEILPAVAWFDEREKDNSAKCRLVFGQALLGLDDAGRAIEVFTQAVAGFGAAGLRGWHAEANVWLGQAFVRSGRSGAEPYRTALAYYESVGSAKADEIRRLLG